MMQLKSICIPYCSQGLNPAESSSSHLSFLFLPVQHISEYMKFHAYLIAARNMRLTYNSEYCMHGSMTRYMNF